MENCSTQRLLFDSLATADILSVTPDTVDRLVELGLLFPSVTIGFRRLFSREDLERFARGNGNPRRINLNTDRVEAASG